MNSKKEYIAIDHEGLHDYNIIVENIDEKGMKYSIFHSNAEHYQAHAKGELVLSMVDTGNEYKLSHNLKVLDYSQATCLRILLSLEKKLEDIDRTPLKYRIIENKEILEV